MTAPQTTDEELLKEAERAFMIKTTNEEAKKPNKLQIWLASIRHILLWKFSKKYRIAVMAFWAVNPNSEIGNITYSSYGQSE